MTKFNKIWGTTSKLFGTNNVEIHRIEINKNSFCSKHFHQYKHNGFYLESGSLEINVWNRDSDILDVTRLKPGDYTTVEPNIDHQFLALEDSIAYEIYWTEFSGEDIIRQIPGGKKE